MNKILMDSMSLNSIDFKVNQMKDFTASTLSKKFLQYKQAIKISTIINYWMKKYNDWIFFPHSSRTPLGHQRPRGIIMKVQVEEKLRKNRTFQAGIEV